MMAVHLPTWQPSAAIPRNPYPDAGFLRLKGAQLLMDGPKGAFCTNQSLIFRKVTGVLMARKWRGYGLCAGGKRSRALRMPWELFAIMSDPWPACGPTSAIF